MTEQYLTLAEVKELLLKEQSARILTLEQNYALEHADKFSKLDEKESKKLVKDLMKIKNVSEPVACKIVDLMPLHLAEVESIFHKERISLDEEATTQILDKVKQYL